MIWGVFFTSMGFAVGLVVFALAMQPGADDMRTLLRIAVWGLLGAALGAKLVQWLAEGWPARASFWSILDPRLGGKALIGGLLGGWLFAEIAKRRLGLRRSTGDLFALALPAGEAVGRVGCWFNGCCYGKPTSGWWAVWQHDAYRHPTQIYSAVVSLAIFLVLLALRGRLAQEGDLFKVYLVLFGVTRFGLEFLRENQAGWLGLTAMQWVCLELAVYGSVVLIWHRAHVPTRSEVKV